VPAWQCEIRQRTRTVNASRPQVTQIALQECQKTQTENQKAGSQMELCDSVKTTHSPEAAYPGCGRRTPLLFGWTHQACAILTSREF
jgi:hypothetical protein